MKKTSLFVIKMKKLWDLFQIIFSLTFETTLKVRLFDNLCNYIADNQPVKNP